MRQVGHGPTALNVSLPTCCEGVKILQIFGDHTTPQYTVVRSPDGHSSCLGKSRVSVKTFEPPSPLAPTQVVKSKGKKSGREYPPSPP